MAEYIERAKAIERIRPHVKPTTVYGEGYMRAIEHTVDILELMPAADVQPVRRGRWEEIEEYGGWGDTYFRCSICGDEWDLDTGTPVENGMKYCPNCGARMIKDGEQNAKD